MPLSRQDKISHKAFEISDISDNFDEMPLVKTVKTAKAIVLDPDKGNNSEIEFIMYTRNLAEKLRPIFPKPNKKTGKITVMPDMIVRIKKHIKDGVVKTKELRNEYPQLVVDVFNVTAVLNNENLNLNPSPEDIKKDVDLFMKYMDTVASTVII